MADGERRSVIITFKPKDARPDPDKDKREVCLQAIESQVHFVDAAGVAMGQQALPGAVPSEAVGYDVNLYEAPILTATLTQNEIEALEADGNVSAVEDDGEVWALEAAPPAEELLVEGGPSPQAETIPSGISQIKAPLAWDCSRGKRIRVAILDSGIDGTHPDIAPNYRGGISFIPDEPTPGDGNGHGTHCAGTIGAAVNGSGVVGVAPSALLYAVKVLGSGGSGSYSGIIAGIDWCITNRMRIVSMSLGGSQAPHALETICNTAWDRGLLLIAAAGNEGPGDNTVGFPAKYSSVVAVSAINDGNVLAEFSSRGPEVELCAPGVNVLSTLPGGSHGRLSGTSMACPHVSGVAALAWGAHRFSDNVTIRRLLARSSDALGRPGRDEHFGYGRVDAAQAAGALTEPPAVPGIP
jgi:subtilisin